MFEQKKVVSVYHGSIRDAARIRAVGLDENRLPTWVSRDLRVALDAIGQNRYEVSQEMAKDPGIIEAQIPVELFNQHFALHERAYNGFGGNLNSTEIVLRHPIQSQIFNQYLMRI